MPTMKAKEAGGTEFFSRDKSGKKQDAALHGELLGDDDKPWDFDVSEIADLSDAELDAWFEARDKKMAE